jgi:hypothetical protein
VRSGPPDRPVGRIYESLVDEAPTPFVTGLEGLDQGMPGGMEVLGRVLVLGIIATGDMTAGHTKPKLDPRVARLQAIAAAI